MSMKNYLDRIRYVDFLIRTKATGSAKQLAKKLQLSPRTTLEHIRVMKDLGCPIKYCRKRNSYYYDEEGKVVISFFDKHFKETNQSGGVKSFL